MVYWLPPVHVGVGVAVPATVGVAVAVAVAVAVDVGVRVAVAVTVAVGVPQGTLPLERCHTSARNWKVDPFIPPTLQISPFPSKPPWFACRLGVGRLGAGHTPVPAGQPANDTSSTSLVESKKPPPWVSPPSAYNLLVPAS